MCIRDSDYGAFTPVQVAATAALNGSQKCVEEIRETYKKRRDVLIESFERAGWDKIPEPEASMFVWAPLPKKFKKMGSMKFAKNLMINADVAVAPGLAFGKGGEGFVRIGLVENTQRISCLLYTSDAADERSSVDLGGRRIIKKK